MLTSVRCVFPVLTDRSWVKRALIMVGASLLLALSARISVPLPFTPIPFAIPVQVTMLLAVLLGGRLATGAVLLYLIQGALGLPVFVFGGGLPYLLGPTGGYLFGYLVGAFAVGWCVERLREKTALKLFLSMALGNGLVILCGVAWLSTMLGWHKAWMLGAVPFILGDALKLILVSSALTMGRLPRH